MRTDAARVARLRLPLQTERLDLVLPDTKYAPAVVKGLNDRAVARWLGKTPFPYHPKDAAEFIARAERRFHSGESLPLWIVDRSRSAVVGGVGLHEFDWEDRKVEVGYWLSRSSWGKGFATEALRQVLPVAFFDLGLERVFAGTFQGNHRSQHVLQKCGFRFEGTLHRSHFRLGAWYDARMFALTADRLPAWLRKLRPRPGRPRASRG